MSDGKVLTPDDHREIEATVRRILAPSPPPTLLDVDREAIVAALRGATLEERRAISRIRSFRNILLSATLVLTLCAVGLLLVGALQPRAIPLCFTPSNTVVCPTHSDDGTGIATSAGTRDTGVASGQTQTNGDAIRAANLDHVVRDTAAPWDAAVVLLLGLMGGALAGAAALRKAEGTSTPYSLPTALALLKLPSGALTAFLGILLLRGQFIPGLSALDSPAQIAAWAVIFGYAQQVFTQMVDGQAKGLANRVGTVDNAKAGDVTIPTDVKGTTVPASTGA